MMNDRIRLAVVGVACVFLAVPGVGLAQRGGRLPIRPLPGWQGPGGAGAGKVDLSTQYQMAECILVGELAQATPGPVAKSMPPIYTYRLKIKVDDVLRGDVEAGKIVEASFRARQRNRPDLPVGETCIVIVQSTRGGGLSATSVRKATDDALKLARTAAGLPLGWRIDGEKVISPWAALGDKAWPKDSGLAVKPDQPVCAETHRPALLCGKGVKLTVEPVEPARKIKWTNPDGDGLYTVTVANTTKAVVEVPALLADEKGNILWDESLVMICQDKARPAPGCEGVSSKVKPAKLEPGQRVSHVVNVLALDDVRWPRGGQRVSFRFCLGERSATKSFYYMSRHHDAIRDASQKKAAEKQ